MMSIYMASRRPFAEYDFDENDSDDDLNASDEDTEDASEGEAPKSSEYTEIKEQMYQDKLAHLKKQLQQLKEGILPEYLKKFRKIDSQYKERLRITEIWKECELEGIERDYVREKKTAAKDFEDRKIKLKESLLCELDDRKRSIQNEHHIMELTGDPMEVKPTLTRKLRPRANDPMPLPEKRRKTSPAQVSFQLDDDDIMEDLAIINKISGKPFIRTPSSSSCSFSGAIPDNIYEARIEDGKLYYDKRWFHRGQIVFVESKETGKISGVICAVGTQEIYVRRSAEAKLTDNNKIKIYLSQLQKGRFTIRRRS